MDWNTILSVLAGGLIALIPTIISNRFQAKEREKERLEQRREIRTQLTIELTKSDIKVIEDAIDNTLRILDGVSALRLKHMSRNANNNLPKTEITPELMSEFVSGFVDADGKLSKLTESSRVADKLATTLGKEFYTEYEYYNRPLAKVSLS